MSLINKLMEVGRKASRGLAVAGLGAYLCLSGLGANGGGCSTYQVAALSSALLEKIGENMEFKLLREKDGSVDVVDTKQFVVIKAYQLLKYDTNSLAPGSYTGIWKIDGKTINNRSITIE